MMKRKKQSGSICPTAIRSEYMNIQSERHVRQGHHGLIGYPWHDCPIQGASMSWLLSSRESNKPWRCQIPWSETQK